MPKQFAYQDAHGILYPAHGALAFQPGLVPGWYDTDTREFTPTGNPQEQTGHIVTDAGVGTSGETVLSGLREDRGADTAPLAGVTLSAPNDTSAADVGARLVETEALLAAERERVIALEAQLAIVRGESSDTPATNTSDGSEPAADAEPAPEAFTSASEDASDASTPVTAPEEPAPDDTSSSSSKRWRKVPR